MYDEVALPSLPVAPKHAATTPTRAAADAAMTRRSCDDTHVAAAHDAVALSLPYLRTRAAQLQWCDAVHTLLRHEAQCRDALHTREYAARYTLRWRAQTMLAAHAMAQHATTLRGEATRRQLRARHVRDAGARRALADDEAAQRRQLHEHELRARAALCAQAAVCRQARDVAMAAAAAERAAALSRDAHALRARQARLAARHYRLPAALALCATHDARARDDDDDDDSDGAKYKAAVALAATLRPRCRRANNNNDDDDGNSSARRCRVAAAQTLAWPVLLRLFDEDFAARQRVRWLHARGQLLVEAMHDRIGVLRGEAVARTSLTWCFRTGACATRLRALLCLQRWWRLLCSSNHRCLCDGDVSTPTRPHNDGGSDDDTCMRWSRRRQVALRTSLCALRQRRRACEWQRRVARLQRRDVAVTASARAADAQARLQTLMTAALSRHRYVQLLDYYAFTLTQRVQAWAQQRCYDDNNSNNNNNNNNNNNKAVMTRWAHAVLYTSAQRLPYIAWRRVRWSCASHAARVAVAALRDDEAAARDALHARERRDASWLSCVHATLRRGADATAWLLHDSDAAAALRDEAAARAVACHDEDTQRQWLQLRYRDALASCRARAQCRADLCHGEAVARAALLAAEAAAFRTHVVDASAAWQWRNVYHAYTRALVRSAHDASGALSSSSLTRNGCLRPSRLSSLDAAAAVVTRFVRRACAARRRAAARAHVQLAQQHCRQLHAQLAQLLRNARASSPSTSSSHGEDDSNVMDNNNDDDDSAARPLVSVQRASGMATTADDVTATYALVAIATTPSNATTTTMASSHAVDAVAAYAAWFDANASQPRAQMFRDVLQRFRARHAAFYRDFAQLAARLRDARARVSDAEATARDALRRRWHYREVVTHQLTRAEAQARAAVHTCEARVRQALCGDSFASITAAVALVHASAWAAATTTTMTTCTTQPAVAVATHNTRVRVWQRLCATATTQPQRQHSSLPRTYVTECARRCAAVRVPLPRLSPQERLCARESVCRARVLHARRVWLAATLWAFAQPLRDAIVVEATALLPTRCRDFDAAHASHAPLACVALLCADEATARAAATSRALVSWSSPLLRAHHHYTCHVVWPQFALGHVLLSGHASHLVQCRLRELLTPRDRRDHDSDNDDVAARLRALQALEAASRQRLAYLADITLQLRVVHRKLPY